MRLSRQAALAVALTLGLAAVILGYFYLRGQQPAPEVHEKVQLPVPVEDIAAETDLTLAMFKPATFKPEDVPKGAIRDASKLHGRIALEPLPTGNPVTQEQVARRSTSLAMAYGVPQNLRAMTIPVDKISGVANFVRPGDHVDCVVIFTDSSGKYSLCQTVLQNLEVLAVNRTTEPANGNSDSQQPQARGDEDGNITVAVTPHEAQLLALSDFRGEIRLTLRRTGDVATETLPPSKSWTLIGTFPTEEKKDTPSAETEPPQPPSWAEMWGQPTKEMPQRPTVPEAETKQPAEKGGIEVIRGSSREYVTPAE